MKRQYPAYHTVCGVFCMFLVLKVEPYVPKKGLFSRLVRKTPPVVTRVAVRGGAYFYLAAVTPDRRGRADFSPLLPLGGCVKRVVPAGPLPALPAPFALYAPLLAPAKLFLHTALFDFAKRRRTFASLGFSDPAGLLAGEIGAFAPFAGELRVFTNAPQRYAAAEEQVLCKWGLPLVLTDRESALAGCAVRLIPFEKNGPHYPGALEADGERRTPSGLRLPPETEKRRPAGADPLLFLSALHELCGAPLSADLCFDALRPDFAGERLDTSR